MKIDLTSLKEGSTEYWEEQDAEGLELPQEEFTLLETLQAHYTLHKAGKNLKFNLEASYRLRLTCSRCLEPFEQSFTEKALYIIQIGTEPWGEEKALTTEEVLMLFLPTTELDTIPILRETVLLSIPRKPLCRPDCKGLCPVCGVNRNAETCNHEEEKVDARWAKLLEIKKQLSKG